MDISRRCLAAALAAAAAGLLAGCTTPAATRGAAAGAPRPPAADEVALLRAANRLTWGADSQALAQLRAAGIERWLEAQLHPGQAVLPGDVQARIDAMTISRLPLEELAREMAEQRRLAEAHVDDDAKKAALAEWQRAMTALGREAQSRALLRALYSPNQIQEQMTWFWMNHFNVFQFKGDIRATVGDYEERAIRPHALGRFRTLLGAVAHHPAMLVYLDNARNGAGRINENYAREIMELHTMGVGSGYTQQDVQQLARIMTGVGVSYRAEELRLPPRLAPYYVRRGAFEFDPRRHDFGAKVFLGAPIEQRGLAEFDEALDRIARAPATARFVARKLALYWMSDEPPPELVERMAAAFTRSDGDIAATLRTLLTTPEFAQAAEGKFKDPMRWVVSAVRLAYDGRTILNAAPMIGWLARMGEPLYGHQTPDGYPLAGADWASSGQMQTRFEIARVLGGSAAGLFRTEGAQPSEQSAFPQLAGALYYEAMIHTLGPATRQALAQAASPQEWNMLLLASPEFMRR